MPGPHCFCRAGFSLAVVSGAAFRCSAWASHAVVSLTDEVLGPQVLAQVLGPEGSGMCGLSCSEARGIFPDLGSNPCLLHCQVNSYPLHHQRSSK